MAPLRPSSNLPTQPKGTILSLQKFTYTTKGHHSIPATTYLHYQKGAILSLQQLNYTTKGRHSVPPTTYLHKKRSPVCPSNTYLHNQRASLCPSSNLPTQPKGTILCLQQLTYTRKGHQSVPQATYLHNQRAPVCPSVEDLFSFSSCKIAVIVVNFSLFVACLSLNFYVKIRMIHTNLP